MYGVLSLLWLIPYPGVSQVGGGVCSLVQPGSAPSQLISVALRNSNHSSRGCAKQSGYKAAKDLIQRVMHAAL